MHTYMYVYVPCSMHIPHIVYIRDLIQRFHVAAFSHKIDMSMPAQTRRLQWEGDQASAMLTEWSCHVSRSLICYTAAG